MALHTRPLLLLCLLTLLPLAAAQEPDAPEAGPCQGSPGYTIPCWLRFYVQGAKGTAEGLADYAWDEATCYLREPIISWTSCPF